MNEKILSKLNSDGFTQGLFPFTPEELKLFDDVANKIKDYSLNERKEVFKHFPIIEELFSKAVNRLNLSLELTDYCFYIEKTDEKNWPLLYHRDSNLPSYLNIDDSQKDKFLKNAIMFRFSLGSSDIDTGALKVLPGSHIGKEKDEVFLPTKEGEVLLFKPLLLHGSNKLKKSHKRRVFQALCIQN